MTKAQGREALRLDEEHRDGVRLLAADGDKSRSKDPR